MRKLITLPNTDGYWATEDGQIWSDKSCRYLKQSNNRGYKQVNLTIKDGDGNIRQTCHRVHRLVALAFSGSSELPVNHIDGNKANNHRDNLEYVTHSRNVRHAIENGLRKPTTLDNNNHGHAKLTNEQVDIAVHRVLVGESTKDVAAEFGVTYDTICKQFRKTFGFGNSRCAARSARRRHNLERLKGE